MPRLRGRLGSGRDAERTAGVGPDATARPREVRGLARGGRRGAGSLPVRGARPPWRDTLYDVRLRCGMAGIRVRVRSDVLAACRAAIYRVAEPRRTRLSGHAL